jgi:hypothetical protein
MLCLDGSGKLIKMMQQKNVCSAVAFADSSSTSESVIWGNSIKQANRMASTMVLLNLGQWHTHRATKPRRNQEGTHVKSAFNESKPLYHSLYHSLYYSLYHSFIIATNKHLESWESDDCWTLNQTNFEIRKNYTINSINIFNSNSNYVWNICPKSPISKCFQSTSSQLNRKVVVLWIDSAPHPQTEVLEGVIAPVLRYILQFIDDVA